MSGINVPGLISLIIFYLLILLVGVLAACLKTRKRASDIDEEATVMVARREIGLCIGIFTMTATWVGGGYINGTSEVVYTSGLLQAQAPVGYAFSLIFGGILFAKIMRERNYFTMLDPFQEKYGNYIGGLLYLPALSGDLMWSAAILNALGSSLSVIMNLDFSLSVISSACIAIIYTFFGGLYSVIFTDVLQLMSITIGLILCVPFAWHSKFVNWDLQNTLNYTQMSAVNSTTLQNNIIFSDDWIGTIPTDTIGSYIDILLMLIFGGIPWQVIYQRVLSVDEPWKARVLSVAAGFGCLALSVPPAIAGIVARYADWDAAGYSTAEAKADPQKILPLVLQYLTPSVVAFLGLGAISAAVMSSSDSSILSASSMFAHNVYKMIIRKQASHREVVIVLRICIVVCGCAATAIALAVPSVYTLFILCSDFVYVLLFPQLLAVIYIPCVNSYGVVSGYALGLVLRLLSGEPLLHISPTFPFTRNFPFRTFAMLVNLLMTVLASVVAKMVCRFYKKSGHAASV